MPAPQAEVCPQLSFYAATPENFSVQPLSIPPGRELLSYRGAGAPRTPPHALSRATDAGALRSRGSLAALVRAPPISADNDLVLRWAALLTAILVTGQASDARLGQFGRVGRELTEADIA
jgi:hypothetical protein